MDKDYAVKLNESYSVMYDSWLKAIENYKVSHEKQSGTAPSEKLIVAFCKFRRIPYPLPNKEDFVKEMVSKNVEVENKD